MQAKQISSAKIIRETAASVKISQTCKLLPLTANLENLKPFRKSKREIPALQHMSVYKAKL